jgi:hypothetical protein
VQAAIGIGWTGLESFALGRVATSASDQKRPFWTMPFNVRFMAVVSTDRRNTLFFFWKDGVLE